MTTPTDPTPLAGDPSADADPLDGHQPDPRLDMAARYVHSLVGLASMVKDVSLLRVTELRCYQSETSSPWPHWAAQVDVLTPPKAPAEGTIVGLGVYQFVDLLRSAIVLADERDRLNALLVDANGEITRLQNTVDGLTELNALNHHADDHPLDPELVGDEGDSLSRSTVTVFEDERGWLHCPLCTYQVGPPNDREANLLAHLNSQQDGHDAHAFHLNVVTKAAGPTVG